MSEPKEEEKPKTFKLFLTNLKDFLVYLVTEPFNQISLETKDIWNVLTKKKSWVFAWFGLFIFVAFLNSRNPTEQTRQLMIFSLVMGIVFFIVYQWQQSTWKDRARDRWYKQHGLVRFKKPK